VMSLFRAPTVAELARLLESAEGNSVPSQDRVTLRRRHHSQPDAAPRRDNDEGAR